MRVGFTGTRRGMTQAQRDKIKGLLKDYADELELHHGDCQGADEEADALAQALGIYRVSHPPTDEKYRAFCKTEETRKPFPYLVRDRHIVDETTLLLGTPQTAHEILRSGTWATIRYAKKSKKPVIVVLPDGRISS